MPTASVKNDESVDMKLEVVVLGVNDVDRAKAFYQKFGWRLDADFATGDFRLVQVRERLHPGEYASRFPKTAEAFDVIRNNRPFKTFNGQVEAVRKVLKEGRHRGELRRPDDAVVRAVGRELNADRATSCLSGSVRSASQRTCDSLVWCNRWDRKPRLNASSRSHTDLSSS